MIEQDTGTAATTAPAEPPRRRTDDLFTTVLERLGGRFGAASVFGTPVEREGVTVIPVATVRFGLGGGAGSDPDKKQEGEGAGVGGALTAAGYIELKGGRSRFVPIVRPERMVALVFLTVVAALAVTRPALGAGKPRRRLPLPR